jgi:lipoteichoic acid synthase
MPSEINYEKSDFCLKYGKAWTDKIKHISLDENIKLSIDQAYNSESNVYVIKHENRYQKNRYIAHAGGAIDGQRYTNSLEALNNSYKIGFKFFELDIIETSDNIYVAEHDWGRWKKNNGYEGSMPPTREIFKSQKINGKYTPIDIYDINEWFREYSDAVLVTDKINRPLDFSNKFVDKTRLMMELFTLEAVKEGVRANIRSSMPNWRVLSEIGGVNIEVLKNLGVKNIVLNRSIIRKAITRLSNLKEHNIKVFAYGVRDSEKFLCNELKYVYGLYADKPHFNERIDCSIPLR